MASRTKQKEEARARRLAEEQARAEKERRTRRLQMLGGVILIAVAIIAVAIALSSGSGGTNNAAKLTSSSKKSASKVIPCQGSPDSAVCSLLSGIPQSGNTLGNPHAKVTVTEYGDLECSVCDAFALGTKDTTSAGTGGTGFENQLIQNEVRTGKVKLVFRSLETASGQNPDQNAFLNQQTAAEAAGLQGKEWYYIELFYHYQSPEGTNYVTPAFLNKLAQHVPGLNVATWQSHLHDQALQSQVTHDEQTAASRGFNSTPTLTIAGPKGQAQPIVGLPSSFSQIQSEINSVL
jgi:protein-disulfide isomerase